MNQNSGSFERRNQLSTSSSERVGADGLLGCFLTDDQVALSELLRFKEKLEASRWLLFELMHFKRALVEKLGVERGFRAYLRALRDPRAADIPGARPIDCDAIEP